MSAPDNLIRELLEQSLVAWRVGGNVEGSEDEAILISASAKSIRIERAQPQMPFRWMVTVGERTRGAISLLAVLRQVREALDPGYAASRARIANASLVPPQ